MRSARFLLAFLALGLVGCSALRPATAPTATEAWQIGEPREGQPDFPPLGTAWVIDRGCGFDPATLATADRMFEQLRLDGIAEVAVVCQAGVIDSGPTNDELIWLRDWARWAELGDVEDDRALAWLIRPDAPASEGRVTVEVSRWLYWYTAIAYADTLREASNYANAGDFNGALVALARNTNEELRLLWATHGASPAP